MKKIILATAALVPAFAFASITDNLYVQGNVGVSYLQAKEDGQKYKDNGTNVSVAVGKDTGAVRYVADYTYLGKLENKEVLSNGSYNAKLTAHSIGASAIYDIATKSAFTPYVGVRVGINNLELKTSEQTSTSNSNITDSKVNVSGGVLAGVQYAINPKVSVDVGAEYNRLGTIGALNIPVNQYGAKAGVRYNF